MVVRDCRYSSLTQLPQTQGTYFIQIMSFVTPIRISIEGGISAGKSTLIKNLVPYLERTYPREFKIIPEPVDMWTDYKSINFLKLFYDDPAKYCYQFQNLVLLSLTQTQKSQENDLIITERSIDSGIQVFARKAQLDGQLSDSEVQLLIGWRDLVSKEFKLSADHVIYIKTDPSVCLERMHRRNRLEENKITLDYLSQISNLHDSWLLDKEHVTVVDGNQDISTVVNECCKIIKEVTEQIQFEKLVNSILI